MFFKKKKTDDLLDEIVVSTSKTKMVEEEIIIPKKSRKSKKNQREKEKNKKQRKQEKQTQQPIQFNFVWFDVDPCDNQKNESKKRPRREKNSTQMLDEVVEVKDMSQTLEKTEETNTIESSRKVDEIILETKVIVDSEDSQEIESKDIIENIDEHEEEEQNEAITTKKELHEYFLQSKEEQEKLKRNPPKKPQKTKSKFVGTDLSFRYKGKKFQKPEDFIKYLDAHYLDLDDIAFDLLNDKLFLTWIGKRSGLFPQSLKEFTKIKKKIEDK